MGRRLILFLCTFLLVGCTNSFPPNHILSDCEIVLSASLRNYIGKNVNIDSISTIIEKSYNIKQKDISVYYYQNQHNFDAEWQIKNIKTIIWVQDGFLYRITIIPKNITIDQVIKCIGAQPEWYLAIYGPDFPEKWMIRYTFQIWYPSIGLFMANRGSVHSVDKLPKLSGSIFVDTLIMVEPGSIIEVHDRIFYGLPLDQQPLTLQPKPWPGDWTNIFFIEEKNYAW